ncbi:hypothetical protein JW859_13715 [bacterium]|nr:hypothetical protein [bacterium]
MRCAFLAACLLVFCVGCGGDRGSLPPEPSSALPPLPAATDNSNADSPVFTVLRDASGTVIQRAEYWQYYDKAASAEELDSSINLDGSEGGFSWVIYQFSDLGSNYVPQELDIFVFESTPPYYVALSNYTEDGCWEFLPTAVAGDRSIEFGTDWNKYVSGTDMYLAILVHDTKVRFEYANLEIDDTRPLPAPTGLAVDSVGAGSVSLSWELYPDARATELRIYQAEDVAMAGAVEAVKAGPTSTVQSVSSLEGGVPYYFALTAYSSDDGIESPYSNIVMATPESGTVTLDGIWPRLGNREDNRGVTDLVGPANFDNHTDVSLTSNITAVENRTSPVIGLNGNVYALSSDGILNCYSADLGTLHWDFDAKDHGSAGADYMCPPHSPILDSAGNAYYIAAPVSPSAGKPYLFCVDSDGEMAWRFDMEAVGDDDETLYATPNITEDGTVIAVINHEKDIVGIVDGEEDWRFELETELTYDIYCQGDPALSGNMLDVPLTDSRMGIPEMKRYQWARINVSTGALVAQYMIARTATNRYAGLPLTSDYYLWPQQDDLVLLDANTGIVVDSDALNLALTASPSRSLDGSWVFQPHPPFGVAGKAYLFGFEVTYSDPPSVTEKFGLQLGASSIYSKPAIDGEGKIYLTDTGRTLYVIGFDQDAPIDAENPKILDTAMIMYGDQYKFNSFAIGDGCVYVVTESNMLYRFY